MNLLHNLESFFDWVWAASWQASVLALLVVLIQGTLRTRLNPRWRHALWLLVVLRLVMPYLPASAVSLFQFAPPEPAALAATVSEPLFPSDDELPSLPVPAEIPPANSPFTFHSVLALLWLAGALVLCAATWMVNHRFAQQIARSGPVTDRDLIELFVKTKAELGISRPIRLIESSKVQSPAIMGLFQPTLLLPIDVRTKFDVIELRLIFLHELAHLKRGDVIVQVLIALLQILHWFNPVLWYAFRRIRIDREPATDALVLSRAGESEKERYGLMLIKLLEHFQHRHSIPTLVGILEDKDQFKRRFSLIARFTRGAYGWSVLGILLIAILSVVCLTKSRATETPATTEPNSGIKKTAPANPLVDAAKNGNLAEVERLLKQGAPSDAGQAAHIQKALRMAVVRDHPDVVKLLLLHGADPNRFGARNMDVLSEAKSAAVVKILLDAGANPNVAGDYDTPLSHAPDAESVQLLVQHGANLKPKLMDNYTLIESVIMRGGLGDNPEVINELIKQGAEFDPKGNGARALVDAAQFNQIGTIKTLLDHGVSPNAFSDDPFQLMTALGSAAWEPSLDSLKLLLARGANPQGDPRQQNSPLEMAVIFGQTESADLLLKAGAHDVGELSIAAARGDAAKVDALLKSGANVNETDNAGNTPLYYAVRRAQVDIVRLLLDRRANVNLFNNYGMTPGMSLELELSSGNPTQFQMDWGVSQEEGTRRAAAFKELLAKYPSDPNYRDSRGRTALHQMAFAENTMVDFLTGDKTHPADPNLLDNDGNTPLLLAALSPHAGELVTRVMIPLDGKSEKNGTKDWNGAAYVAYLLIKAGAKVNLVVANGKTVGELAMDAAQKANNPQLISVLHDAGVADNSLTPNPTSSASAAGNSALNRALISVVRNAGTDKVGHGDVDQVQKLLDQGADPNAKDQRGTSALTWALNFGKDDAAVLLLQHGADGSIEDTGGENSAWLASMIYFCPNALDLMIKKGIDITKPNKGGRDILSAIITARPASPAKMNYLNDRVWTDAEYQAYLEREHRVVDLLAAAGVDVNAALAPDFHGHPNSETPLMAFIQSGHYEAAKALIAHGAKLDLKDKNGNVALAYIFLWAGIRPLPLDLLETMLKLGSNPNAPYFPFADGTPVPSNYLTAAVDLYAKTPVQIAERIRAIQILIDYGADPTLKDSTGETAISYAQKHHPELVPILQSATKSQAPNSDTGTQSPAVNAPLVANVQTGGTANSGTPAAMIRIALKVVQINEDDYQAHRDDIESAVANGNIEPLGHLASFDLMSEPFVLVKAGEQGVLEAVRVLPYPVDFKKDANGKLQATDFKRKNLGVRFILAPSTVDAGKINVNGKLTVTNLQGWVKLDEGAYQPVFHERLIGVSSLFTTGQTKGYEADGDAQLLPLDPSEVYQPDKPHDQSKNPLAQRRLFLFVTADAYSSDGIEETPTTTPGPADPTSAAGNGLGESAQLSVNAPMPDKYEWADKFGQAGATPSTSESPRSITPAAPQVADRAVIIRKLQTITFDHVDFDKEDITDVLQYLVKKSGELDPDHQGVSFVLRLDSGTTGSSPAKPDPSIHREITLHEKNVSLAEIVGAVVDQSKLSYAIEDYAVYLRPHALGQDVFSVRTYLAPANFMSDTLPAPGEQLSPDGKTIDVAKRFVDLGFKFPAGATAILLPESNKLVIRNTPDQLDLIADYIEHLADQLPPPISPKPPTFPKHTVYGHLMVHQPNQVDFAKSSGVLQSVDGSSGHDYPFTIKPDGSYTVPNVASGVYNQMIRLVEKDNGENSTPEQYVTLTPTVLTLDDTLENKTVNEALAVAFDDESPKGSIKIGLIVIEIPDDLYQAKKAAIDTAVDKADLSLFNNLQGVSILSTPSVTTVPGQLANIDIVREFPFPTSYDPSEKVAKPSGLPPGYQLYIPPTPREFTRKDVGVRVEVTPLIEDVMPSNVNGYTQSSKKIVHNGKLTVTTFEGFTKSNYVGQGMPSFNTTESSFIEALDDRQEMGFWVPGEHVDEQAVSGQPLGVVAGNPTQAVKKRYLLFVSANRVE